MKNSESRLANWFYDLVCGWMLFFWDAFYRGVKKTTFLRWWSLFWIVNYFSVCFILICKRWLFWFLSLVLPALFGKHLDDKLERYKMTIPCLIYFVLTLAIYFFLKGVVSSMRINKYQKLLDLMKFKSGVDRKPIVTDVIVEDEHKTIIKVVSIGVGVDHYQNAKGDLEASFGVFIDKICTGGDPKFIEIHLTKRRIPERCKFIDYEETKMEPYSFVVGESVNGLVTKKITELPHMLIAGTTGGGKSVFFKQVILWLHKTSPKLQLYLLDLKGGIEMKQFDRLSNICVCKDISSSLQTLTAIDLEMKNRFQYLESKSYKEIEPNRDKMDRIIVGVDEASMLYGLVTRTSNDYQTIMKAREITDRIAKLGRAAGIHLILATQKITKETIGTSIQENVTGRMCFRMNTQQGSQVVLGDKSAMNLPENPGRAIWQCGSKRSEVQALYLTEEDIDEYVEGKSAIQDAEKEKPKNTLLNVSTMVNETTIETFAEFKGQKTDEVNCESKNLTVE